MKRQIAVIALITFGLLAFLGTACEGDKITVASPNGNTLQGITVSGEGKATGQPDIALLSLGISTLRPTVAEARDEAASTMQKVIDSVKGNGVAEKDIQSTQYSIYPEYDYSIRGSQKLLGYRITNTVSIKVRDIDKTSDVLDGATAAGGDLTQVQNITFTIDEPDALRDQAREDAVKDAKARAQRLADTAGVKLGDPISITESSVSPPVPMAADMRETLGSGEESTPIQPGELDVNLTVQVVFAIE
ncbi:MAG TPA: SIMPL domain-containing protein [Dehalococcoidia bacterium]|nr:SIMPL domain-containing protein [Dehalococcoidia bacterium]